MHMMPAHAVTPAPHVAEVAGPLDPHEAAQIPPSPPPAVGAAALEALLQQFRSRIEDPLLALPDPKVVRRRLFQVSQPSARRSKRLAAKGKGTSAIKRAQRILMHKLGVSRMEERLSAAQLDEYAAIFASPLGPEQVSAIAALFGLPQALDGDGDEVVTPAV
jgi:hypothetical protein